MSRFFATLIVLVSFAACFDKVRDDEIEAQGGETPGIGPGDRHRAGQNCTACHGPLGGEGPEISVGGTVYERIDSEEPAAGARVFVTDFKNETRAFTTNDVGNFHAPKESWDPVFPLRMVVEYSDGSTACRQEMFSLSRRDGGCGKCHDKSKPSNGEHMPRVYAIKEGCPPPTGAP
jgi:cytochrome c553